jgi:hypothetical protein
MITDILKLVFMNLGGRISIPNVPYMYFKREDKCLCKIPGFHRSLVDSDDRVCWFWDSSKFLRDTVNHLNQMPHKYIFTFILNKVS